MTLLERSARIIDEGVDEGQQAIHPMDGSFHEIADDVAIVCAFSHVWSVATEEGLVAIDTSLPGFAPIALDHLRRWKGLPVDNKLLPWNFRSPSN